MSGQAVRNAECGIRNAEDGSFRMPHAESRTLRWTALTCALSLASPGAAWATQRPVKSKFSNHQNAPVVIKQTKVVMVETFAAPTQAVTADDTAKRSGVRYANRAGMLPSTFVLKGEVVCQNKGTQPVEAISLAVVLLDPFHQPIQLPGQSAPRLSPQVVTRIPRGTSQSVIWEHSARSMDLFEVAVVIIRVRFQDGSVWTAPPEELTDIF